LLWVLPWHLLAICGLGITQAEVYQRIMGLFLSEFERDKLSSLRLFHPENMYNKAY
jgi:hypothetical protein